MSGGHFNYDQYRIDSIAESIESYIYDNNDDRYTPETLDKFREAVVLLRKASVYAQRIDWLLSGDDSEESFHKRLDNDLRRLALYELTAEDQRLGLYDTKKET